MDQITDIITKVIRKLEDRFERELDAIAEAGREARDGDSLPLDLSINDELPINESIALTEAGVSLEQRLFRHINYYIRNAKQREKQLIKLLIESIGSYRRFPALNEESGISSNGITIDTLLLFAPFWIRDPLDWDRSSDVSIVEHLFVEYPVPKKLYGMWYKTLDTKNLKYLVWFILLAQGGSLKKASKWFGWNTPSRFQHFYIQLAKKYSDKIYNVSILDLIIGAEINRLGGSDRHMILFSKNTFFKIDPTDNDEKSDEFIGFWYQTIHWFINNGRYINDLQYEAILCWAASRYLEEKRQVRYFSWKERTAENVIEASAQYLPNEKICDKNSSWDRHGHDWRFVVGSDMIWTISEITNIEELERETESLSHCAINYANNCMVGSSVIFSMKCNQERVATIELDGQLNTIRQAKGFDNRELTQVEKIILNIWFRQEIRRGKNKSRSKTIESDDI